jgi:hypothetical protein
VKNYGRLLDKLLEELSIRSLDEPGESFGHWFDLRLGKQHKIYYSPVSRPIMIDFIFTLDVLRIYVISYEDELKLERILSKARMISASARSKITSSKSTSTLLSR